MLVTSVNNLSFTNNKTPEQKNEKRKNIIIASSVPVGSTLTGLAIGAIVNVCQKDELLKGINEAVQAERNSWAARLKQAEEDSNALLEQADLTKKQYQRIIDEGLKGIQQNQQILNTNTKLTSAERNAIKQYIEDTNKTLLLAENHSNEIDNTIVQIKEQIKRQRKPIEDYLDSFEKGQHKCMQENLRGNLIRGTVIGLITGLFLVGGYFVLKHFENKDKQS